MRIFLNGSGVETLPGGAPRKEVSVIDWERVAELREEVGEEDFAEVVDLFLDEVESALDRLKRTAPPALEGELHFVKGSAMTLGFQDLAEICRLGERSAAEARFDAIDIPAVLNVYAQSKAEFMDLLH
jgi:HPt (histidine-containing phosphotransfer) domain-containing protein